MQVFNHSSDTLASQHLSDQRPSVEYRKLKNKLNMTNIADLN